MTRFHKHRYWGMCYCAAPCINGSYGPYVEINYNETDKAAVREIVRRDPQLRDEFVERVLRQHDWEFWREFMSRVRADALKKSETGG